MAVALVGGGGIKVVETRWRDKEGWEKGDN